jgi:serine protease Do
MRSGTRTGFPAAAAIVALGALAGCRERPAGSSGLAIDRPPGGPAAAPAPPPATARVLYPSAPGSFVDLVAGARRGVVAIRAGAPVKSGPAAVFPGTPETTADVALGTGFLIELTGGVAPRPGGAVGVPTPHDQPSPIDVRGTYVLTTDHIAAATPDLHVVLPDRRDVPARRIGRDPRLDLALLSITAPGTGSGSGSGDPAGELPGLAPLPLGNSDELQVGEWLVVLGDPFGDEVTAAVGVVSATGRDAVGSLVPGRATGFRTFLQTDARIHRGNSGGPVLDTAGQVVGVAVATGDRPGEVSFAVPINRIKEILDALRDTGGVARSWLGVLAQPVSAELAQTAGLAKPSGALVTEVKLGSPAAAAGLRVGDIVLAWGDREVDHRTLPWIVAQAPAGQAVTVAVWRNRARSDVAVTPQRMPE